MISQNYLQVTKERGERTRRYDDIESRVEGAAARGKAPTRTHFSKSRKRFVDNYGRVYILPVKGDRHAEHLMESKEVGRYFDDGDREDYVWANQGAEEDNRGDQIGQQLPNLKGSVFMYVWRPRKVPHVNQSTGEQIPAMPPSRGTPGDDGTDFFLYESDESYNKVKGGDVYKADVYQTQTKRRSERGQVIFNNVSKVN